jgi:hypothetical protein
MKPALLRVVLIVSPLVLLTIGCDRKPQRAEVPGHNPAAAAQKAIATYDKNADGAISGDELKAVPALIDNPELPMKLIDKNSDGKVTADEIQAREQAWLDSKVGIMSFHCTVTVDGKPLEGAKVVFEPEAFHDGAVNEASGTTGADGTAVIAVDKTKLPDHLKDISGMQTGFYKVRISHPTAGLPAKYNTETTLGQEVSSDAVGSINVTFALTSR